MTPTEKELDYAQRRSRWLACMNGDDRNTIINQMTRLIWNMLAFRTVNESRRYANVDVDGKPMLNGMLHGLINDCFWDSTITAVRRLADTESIESASSGRDNSVFSLVAVTDDIIKNAKLVTRSSMMEAEGLPYHYDERAAARKKYVEDRIRSGESSFIIPTELDVDIIDQRHQQIDSISRTSPDQRSPEDQLCVDTMMVLRNQMKNSAANFKNFADKYIAHAATPSSRGALQPSDFDISLKALDDFIETACRAYGYISLYVLGTHENAFPSLVAYDHLEYLDQPIASLEVLRTLDTYWKDQAKKIDGWTAYSPAELHHTL